MELKEKLVILREERNMSQGELAGKVGVSRQTVSKWEQGRIVPSAENLIALGRLYGVPLDELVNGEAPEERSLEAEADPPVQEEAPTKQRNWWKVLAVCLAVLLAAVVIASTITIWTVVTKEPANTPVIINQDDLEGEDIDPSELVPFDGTWEPIE